MRVMSEYVNVVVCVVVVVVVCQIRSDQMDVRYPCPGCAPGPLSISGPGVFTLVLALERRAGR